MSKEDGGPAFPTERFDNMARVEPNGYYGMSLRDYFAAQVMGHMISLSTDTEGGWSAENVANGCYNLADAMLKARKEPSNG